MEFHTVGSGGLLVSSSNVPAFLTKLWTLVDDPETDLICWSPPGNSFHVFDQGRFSKEVLPKYFKHKNMTSFTRQLNMYGFHKVVHIEQGTLTKPEKDDTEYHHPYFVRGQKLLLKNIKRKVSNVKHEDLKPSPEDVTKMISDMQQMKGKQESVDSEIITLKQENAALKREVATLRQTQAQQQEVINKVLQFLDTLGESNRVCSGKRKMSLVLNNSSTEHSMPKFRRKTIQEPLEHSTPVFSASTTFAGTGIFSSTPVSAPVKTGTIISDVTDVAQVGPINLEDRIEDRSSVLNNSSTELSTPDFSKKTIQEPMEHSTPVFSSSTGIFSSTPVSAPVKTGPIISDVTDVAQVGPFNLEDRIEDRTRPLVHIEEQPSSTTYCPEIVEMRSVDMEFEKESSVPADMSLSPTMSINSILEEPEPTPASSSLPIDQKCLNVACLDKVEFTNHLEMSDNSLEIFGAQSLTFDSLLFYDIQEYLSEPAREMETFY